MKSEQFWKWYENYAVPLLTGDGKSINRVNTFRKMLEYLDQFPSPTIVETGCIEGTEPENWVGNGCSTIIFDNYISYNGGGVYSVDIDPAKVLAAREKVSKRTRISCGDSVEFLRRLRVKPNLLYLDASHLSWHQQTPAQVHHYNELMAAMPGLQPETLVVVDDSPSTVEIDDHIKLDVTGKGGLIAKYATEVGAEMVFTEYQTGWLGFPGFPDNSDYNTDIILKKARNLVELGRWNQAYGLYKTVLARTPQPWNGIQRVMHGEACAFFARLALQVRDKRYGAAYDWFERALRADPRAVEYRIELATKVMRPLGLIDSARDEAGRCVRISPDDPQAWRTLGLMEGLKGNIKGSAEAHATQVRLSNRSVSSLIDTAASLIDLEMYDRAEPLCDEALATGQTAFKGDVLHCKAMITARRGDHEAAIDLYNEAINCKCHDPTLAHFHLALSLFSIGRYKEGWEHQAKIEHNTSDPALYVPMRRFDRPLFKMQPPPAVVHVHAEAGAGDNLAMWRYLPLLVGRGYTVRYEIRSDLLKLAQDSLPGVEVIETAPDYPGTIGLSNFDYHCPVGELPYAFGTDIDTVPWGGPYIKTDPRLVRSYRGVPKIGIAWSSGIRGDGTSWLKRYGELKSLSFELISPIIETGHEKFVSLQVGPPRGQSLGFIADVLPQNPTWAETAALIENLDLVITPDTGLAHLAGAMGKPTWLMMHSHNMGWHFMCERPGARWNEHSPWYPTVRIFRQKGESWQLVITAIVEELAALTAKELELQA